MTFLRRVTDDLFAFCGPPFPSHFSSFDPRPTRTLALLIARRSEGLFAEGPSVGGEERWEKEDQLKEQAESSRAGLDGSRSGSNVL